MHPKLQLKMRKNIGLENSKNLIPIFDSLNIGSYEDDLVIENNLIKISKASINSTTSQELIAKIKDLSKEEPFLYTIVEDDSDISINTNQLVKEKKLSQNTDNEPSSYTRILSNIFTGERKHYTYGEEWVANRNIVSKPDGELIVLNNPDDPYNTIHPGDVIQYLKLGKNFQQVGDLRLIDNSSNLHIHCLFGKGMEETQEVQDAVKSIVGKRSQKEVSEILDKHYAEELSHTDFDHGHPITNPESPDEIYILYHTYEHCKPKLK